MSDGDDEDMMTEDGKTDPDGRANASGDAQSERGLQACDASSISFGKTPTSSAGESLAETQLQETGLPSDRGQGR